MKGLMAPTALCVLELPNSKAARWTSPIMDLSGKLRLPRPPRLPHLGLHPYLNAPWGIQCTKRSTSPCGWVPPKASFRTRHKPKERHLANSRKGIWKHAFNRKAARQKKGRLDHYDLRNLSHNDGRNDVVFHYIHKPSFEFIVTHEIRVDLDTCKWHRPS